MCRCIYMYMCICVYCIHTCKLAFILWISRIKDIDIHTYILNISKLLTSFINQSITLMIFEGPNFYGPNSGQAVVLQAVLDSQ